MDTLTYWENAPTDQPWLLNGFKGTWAFSDHSLIPGELNNFIMESFHPEERMKRISLDDINKLMNDVWEGPGSMVKIQKMYIEMRNNRLANNAGTSKLKLEEVKTIDDFDESDFKPVIEALSSEEDE